MARIYARCVACGNTLPVIEMHKANPLDRGGKPGYVCNSCANMERNYTFANSVSKGTSKSENWTASHELELSGYTTIGKANLMHNGYAPTSDCSVELEMKSPIYNGFGGIVKYAKSIEKMLNSGDLEINYTCGDHLHIGRTDIINHLTGEVYDFNAECLDALWEFRYEILTPLNDYLSNNPGACRKVFGRALTGYADNINRAYENDRREHTNRYAFINFCTEGKNPVTGEKSPRYAKTLEFRINYFDNATQISKAVMLEKAIFSCMIVNFLDYYKAHDNIQSLKRQAIKTGEKLLRLFQKVEND